MLPDPRRDSFARQECPDLATRHWRYTVVKSVLADQDIQPSEVLRESVAGELDLEIGVDSDEEALTEALQGIDVLFGTSRLPLTRHVLEKSDLNVLAKIGTGLDNVDLAAARELNIPVTYTPGINAQAVAEHTVGLTLAVARNVVANDRSLAEGYWRDAIELGTGISGKTYGIVGFGRIGRRVAGVLSGFNVDVLAYDPYVLEQDTDITGTVLTSLEDLLNRSDIVAINAELNEETRGLISHSEFETMKESAIIVNTGRGPIVSEDALVEALERGQIAGAGLDVYETEPLPPSSPLHAFDNVVATPHVAGMTQECRVEMIETLVSNTLGLLNDRQIPERYIATQPRR